MAAPAPGPAPRPASGGGLLTQKLGPLATWVWLLIATVGIVIYYVIAKYRKGKSSSATAGQAQPGQVTGQQYVPDIILQDYQTQTASPVINVPGATPPAQPPPAPPPVNPGGPNKPPPAPPKSTPPKGKSPQPPIFNSSYTVRKGDTLAAVAQRFSISRVELAHANGFGTGAGLRTGQRLKVPSPAPGGHPNPAP